MCPIEMTSRELRRRRLREVVLLACVVSASEAGAQPTAAADAVIPGPMLVVRVANEAKLPHDLLQAARLRAGEIFESAGVSLQWRDVDEEVRPRTTGAADVFVVLASTRLTAVICTVNRLPPHTMGAAMARQRQLAYVFTDRIQELATRKRLMPSTILGEVIAHELGHLLLPDLAHAKGGVMRATLDVRFHGPAQFTQEEAAALRARLSPQESR
jgi:hypothetical protein